MLEIGKVYRLSRKEKSPDAIEVDGLPNFFLRDCDSSCKHSIRGATRNSRICEGERTRWKRKNPDDFYH